MLCFFWLAQGALSSGGFSGQTFALMEAHSPSLNGAVGMDEDDCRILPFCSLPESPHWGTGLWAILWQTELSFLKLLVDIGSRKPTQKSPCFSLWRSPASLMLYAPLPPCTLSVRSWSSFWQWTEFVTPFFTSNLAPEFQLKCQHAFIGTVSIHFHN